MAWQEKPLFQARLNSTSLTSVYSPPDNTTAIIKYITICNTTAATVTFRICLDADGTTYSEATAVFWEIEIEGYKTLPLNVYWPINDTNGNLAFQNSVANACTITGFGVEIT